MADTYTRLRIQRGIRSSFDGACTAQQSQPRLLLAPSMTIIVLDTNIYDRLEADPTSVERINQLILNERIAVLVPRQVAAELRRRPTGMPALFPVNYVGHAVARAGVMCAGDFLGTGEVYDAHRGNSLKDADAFIADVATMVADWFVSEDVRCLRRFPSNTKCEPLRYEEFRGRLLEL